LLDVSVDYVGRDGVADMRTLVSKLASASTLPLVIDSTEPAVIQAGLELIGGRPVVNSVNFEDGDGPNSRFAKIMPLVKEHGAAVIALTIDEQGQARNQADKVRIASRLIDDLISKWDMRVEDIIVDALTFPIATGQEETRRDGLETIAAIKEITRETAHLPVQQAFDMVTKRRLKTVDVLYSSEDQLEGARAFAEKRKPQWKGK
jgi:5-methyltetrahydrofolate--homocysteine methyltransferase